MPVWIIVQTIIFVDRIFFFLLTLSTLPPLAGRSIVKGDGGGRERVHYCSNEKYCLIIIYWTFRSTESRKKKKKYTKVYYLYRCPRPRWILYASDIMLRLRNECRGIRREGPQSEFAYFISSFGPDNKYLAYYKFAWSCDNYYGRDVFSSFAFFGYPFWNTIKLYFLLATGDTLNM